jgi:GntR family transcriptional repressor for pyruvate dehydrogenase complex
MSETRPQDIKKIRSVNKSAMVIEKLLDYIINGHFKPGDRLPPENILTGSFGVSRVTIRESLKQLQSMGVISIRQGEGTFVNKLTPARIIEPLLPLLRLEMKSLDELFEARICIETGIAQLASRNRTQEDIDRMKALIQPMEDCLQSENYLVYNELDAQFHALIGEAAKNEILFNMYMMLKEIRNKNISITNSTIASIVYSIYKHKELLDAIERQDVINIASIMRVHLSFAKSMNEQAYHSFDAANQQP